MIVAIYWLKNLFWGLRLLLFPPLLLFTIDIYFLNRHEGILMEAKRVSDWLWETLTQLQTRYPTIIRQVEGTDLSVDIVFYIEDLAMECVQALLDAGITAIHRLDRPRVISLQIPSLEVQDKAEEAVKVIEAYLKATT